MQNHNCAILRCLGFEKKQLVYYVIFDFTFITVLFIIIGVLIGKLVHILMIKVLNCLYHI
ncbi:FtsX-like permease family protein [Ruminococcus sp.]|uniref:FtsX-like permease family protein n=1 Tax=Ruminococcus sp. TaxID=41978 RepID=UPI00344D98D7